MCFFSSSSPLLLVIWKIIFNVFAFFALCFSIILGTLNCGEVVVCGDGRLLIGEILRVPENLNKQTDIVSFGSLHIQSILLFDPVL